LRQKQYFTNQQDRQVKQKTEHFIHKCKPPVNHMPLRLGNNSVQSRSNPHSMKQEHRQFKRARTAWPATAGAIVMAAGLTVGLSASLSANPAKAQTVSDQLSNSSLQALSTADVNSPAAKTETVDNMAIAPSSQATGTIPTATTGQADDFKTPVNPRYTRENPREDTVDGLRASKYDADSPGMRVGSFVLRPSISQGLGVENTVSGSSSSTRTYSETTLDGDLISDWDRHQLRLKGTGIWQKNISGTGSEEPSANIDATLRLDMTRDTTINITGGYNFARQSNTDPNSISGASVQSGVHTFKAGIAAVREFGIIRGTIGADMNRTVYGPATLADGSSLSMSDRNQTTGELKLRLGYEISPAIIPFVEVSGGKSIYDQTVDTSGYHRDARFYAAKTGVEFDFGEKLRGEIGGGYRQVSYEDARLASVGAMTVDGNVTWSPRRGTDVTLGVSTSVDPSTTAGTSAATNYGFSAAISQQMIDNLVARLSGASTFTRYPSGSSTADQTEWVADAGLTWSLNRYIDITGDLGIDFTHVDSGSETTVYKAIAGIKFKR
jgi:hypothetical protein